MGLLTKIIDRKKQTEQKNVVQPPAGPVFFPEREPIPLCDTCQGEEFWFDRYGGGPHCTSCRPWPSRSLVGRIVVAVAGNGPDQDDWIEYQTETRIGIVRRDYVEAMNVLSPPEFREVFEAIRNAKK